MKEPLEVCAINIKNFIKGKPEFATISLYDSENPHLDQKRLYTILKMCSEKGYVNTRGKKRLKNWFEVKQILYRGQWSRFENYDSEGHEGVADLNKYIMSFDEFERRGRPRKIYIDFHKAVSTEDFMTPIETLK